MYYNPRNSSLSWKYLTSYLQKDLRDVRTWKSINMVLQNAPEYICWIIKSTEPGKSFLTVRRQRAQCSILNEAEDLKLIGQAINSEVLSLLLRQDGPKEVGPLAKSWSSIYVWRCIYL